MNIGGSGYFEKNYFPRSESVLIPRHA